MVMISDAFQSLLIAISHSYLFQPLQITRTITKTRLYNFDPLKPHFYIVKLGFTGVYIIFLITAQNIDCGYSLESPIIFLITAQNIDCGTR